MKLELHDVWSGYGRVGVLRGATLSVPNGAAVALLGTNGAGKSTLLKTAAGQVRARRGSVSLGGEAVTHLGPSRRAKKGLCMIPEGRGIFRLLTVRENLAMQAGGHDPNALKRAADAFPILGERLDQRAGTLSGGQQQMLALARAFVADTPLILADELSLGLAPIVVDQIYEAVTTLRSAGRSMLIVEQYVERVLPIVDYVYVLHKGSVVFVGEPAQCVAGSIFDRYLHGNTNASQASHRVRQGTR